MPESVVTLSAHDAAMVAKVDSMDAALRGTPVVPPKEPAKAPPAEPVKEAPKAAATKPEGVPDKFWDAATGVVRYSDWSKSTAELEKSLSQAKEPPKEPAKEPAKAPEGVKPEAPAQPLIDAAKAAEEAAKAAGGNVAKVDFQALTKEFAETGSLSTEAYGKLEASGLSKDIVDSFIAGQQALAVQQRSEAHGLVGGEKQYEQMLDWAATNMSKAEQAAFDASVIKDSATRKQAIVALQAQYAKAVGTNPALVVPAGGEGAAGGVTYQSRAEVTADMRDPRYKSDPAFRALVERKLANSTVF